VRLDYCQDKYLSVVRNIARAGLQRAKSWSAPRWGKPSPPPPPAPPQQLDHEFQRQLACADLGGLLDKGSEDGTTCDLLIQTCELYSKQFSLPVEFNRPPLRADEAQNFAPSRVGTACKGSALSLVAQARKYGLGMIFATQLPKGMNNAIVSNCTTHVYGRMSSPATIQATQELMAAKGGAAEDIGRLIKGEFYFSTEGFARPNKVRTPLCLSWLNPPTADEVVQRARARSV
jgi:hypothetical protein